MHPVLPPCHPNAHCGQDVPLADALSQVLRAVHLTGAVYFAIEASDPWVAETPPSREIGPRILPRAEHVIEYHVVTAGSCWGGIVDEPAVQLEAGDVLVFPQGDRHVVSSAPGMRGGPSPDSLDMQHARLPISIDIRGGGPRHVKLICGFLGCDAHPFNPLLSALPRLLHVRGTGERRSILQRLVELAVVESNAREPGSDCVLARLSELLFVEVVRHYVETLPQEQGGWFAGLQDPQVGRALQKLHAQPADPWTLNRLAKGAGVSRSVLAERFTRLVGIPPMQYLARWRIQLAASQLRASSASLAEIAQQVGYSSEGALSKAFKRCVGVAPATYRQA
ncbi:MAG: AraC family transcriptional regulator [Myxococcales bacterium]